MGLAATAAIAQPAAVAPIEIGGMRIPLPPGDWRQLGEAQYAVAGRRDGESGQVRSLVLGWTVADRVVALAVLRANAAPVPGGFGIASDCNRRDLHLARMETPRGSALASCSFVGHLVHAAGPSDDPAWRAALARLSATGAAAPSEWLVAGFRMADDDDLLDLRLLLDPALLGIAAPAATTARSAGTMQAVQGWVRGLVGAAPPPEPTRWQRSAWAPAAVATDPQRALVLAYLVEWVDEVRTPLRLGFKGRDAEAPGWPGPWQVALGLAPPPAPALGSGIMTDQSARTEALWKTLSWRVLGSTLDAAVALAFTGSAGAASGITLVGGTINAAAYYLHELVWDDVGSRGSAGETTTDLPGLGEDGRP